MIEIDKTAQVSPLADIEDSVRGSRIAVGPHSIIDSFVKVKPAGGSGNLIIGSYSIINSGCVLKTRFLGILQCGSDEDATQRKKLPSKTKLRIAIPHK
jgi:hypothetical protein